MYTEKNTLKFGIYSSIALVLLTLITWTLAMMAVPPAGPYCPGDCMAYPFSDLLDYYPRDYYWMYLAVFQVFAYLIFIIVNHFIASVERKLFSFISTAFAAMASVVLLITYFVQFSVVPISVMEGETEGIALITQYNGHGIFIAMEDLGYITMSISFFFLAFSFSTKKALEKTIRLLWLSAFPLIVMAFVAYTIRFGLDRSYRFEVAAISINWIVIIISGILLSILLNKKLKSTK